MASTTEATDQIRLAILPFKNMMGDDDVSPLILGFTEDLVINFSRFIGISVISYYSTVHIKSVSDRAKIEALNADYLITGSFRNRQDAVRINVHLVNNHN